MLRTGNVSVSVPVGTERQNKHDQHGTHFLTSSSDDSSGTNRGSRRVVNSSRDIADIEAVRRTVNEALRVAVLYPLRPLVTISNKSYRSEEASPRCLLATGGDCSQSFYGFNLNQFSCCEDFGEEQARRGTASSIRQGAKEQELLCHVPGGDGLTYHSSGFVAVGNIFAVGNSAEPFLAAATQTIMIYAVVATHVRPT